MFIQVLEGKVADADALRAGLDTWRNELQGGAEGWLGTTAGFTADGGFIGVVRFESAEAAQANSQRPEQGEWWNTVAAAFDGEVKFTDCPEVDTFGAGGSDDAGFVQIMMGHADRAVVAPAARELEEILHRMRPDVIGGTVAWPGDGSFIQTVYFSSEAEARKNEGAAPANDEDRAAMERLGSLMTFDRYIDLSDPMLYSR
jgi:hypothetical protein